jgi:hypothetical protein
MSQLFERLPEHPIDPLKKDSIVIGAPFKLGAHLCIPLLRINTGKTPLESAAGHFTATGIEPMGFVVNNQNHVNYISAQPCQTLGAAIARLPQMLETTSQSTE